MTEYRFGCPWKGSNALIQGIKNDGANGWYIHQAVPTSTIEDIRVHRYTGTVYRGFQTFPHTGHGSAIGVMKQSYGARLFLPGDNRGVLQSQYKIGDSKTPVVQSFLADMGWCSGVTLNGSVLSIRSGGGAQKITLVNILNPKTPLARFRFNTPKGIYQGHYTGQDLITYFAWESDGGAARGTAGYRAWITAHDTAGRIIGTIDITKWYPKGEPEGLCSIGQTIYVAKRVGPTGKNRFVAIKPIKEF